MIWVCCMCMSVLCFRDGFMFCVTFPAWAFSYIFIMGVYVEILCLLSDPAEILFLVNKKRWHTLWTFQLEIRSNTKVIAKKPLTNWYEMNSSFHGTVRFNSILIALLYSIYLVDRVCYAHYIIQCRNRSALWYSH